MAILRAIGDGERDAGRLAKCGTGAAARASREIAEPLSGHWREDRLFSLRQSLKMYDAIQERIAEYNREILGKLAAMRTEYHGIVLNEKHWI
jgi:hypothetical protein